MAVVQVNPGQYHEVHPGQVDVESVKVDFQHRSKDRWVGIIGQLIDLQRHSQSTTPKDIDKTLNTYRQMNWINWQSILFRIYNVQASAGDFILGEVRLTEVLTLGKTCFFHLTDVLTRLAGLTIADRLYRFAEN